MSGGPTLSIPTMSKLKRTQPPARYRGEQFNRELNAKLATSRAFGSSAIRRLPVVIALARAKAENPDTLVAYVPPIPRGLLTAGRFRVRRKDKPLKVCAADTDVLLTDHTGSIRYARLTNGQIVRAQLLRRTLPEGERAVFVSNFGQQILNPADLKLTPMQELPRHAH